MAKTYKVSMCNNRDGVTDERSGFTAIEEAIEWALGHDYHRNNAYFAVDNGGKLTIGVKINGDDDFNVYDGWDFRPHCSAAELAECLVRNLSK